MSNPPKVVRTPTIGFTYSLATLTENNTFVVFVGEDVQGAIQNKDEPVEFNFSGTIDGLRASIRDQQSSIETLIYKNEEAIVRRLRNAEDTSKNHIDFDLSSEWSTYVDGLVLDSLHSSLEDGDLIRFSITLKTTDNNNDVTLVYYCKNVSIVGN
jgi:hypothetical protein